MSTARILFICFLMCVVTGVSVWYLGERQHRKTGVADAIRLFDEFHMKKELEAEEKVKLEGIKKQVDSISKMLQLARASKDEEGTKRLSYAFGYMQSELERVYKQSNHDINEQVWKRLNPAVEEYGKQKGLHVIIGANGMGSVLYNDEYYDLTNDLIKFVNQKYDEGN